MRLKTSRWPPLKSRRKPTIWQPTARRGRGHTAPRAHTLLTSGRCAGGGSHRPRPMPALHAGPRAAGAFAGRHPFAREMPLPAWRKGPLQGSILSSGTVRRAGSPRPPRCSGRRAAVRKHSFLNQEGGYQAQQAAPPLWLQGRAAAHTFCPGPQRSRAAIQPPDEENRRPGACRPA